MRRRILNMPMLYRSKEYGNPFIMEVLPDNSWKDKPCFIIGGGPSLKDFDWTKLKGKRTIGINLAYLKHDPTIIFSMDTRFLNWLEQKYYGPEALDLFWRSPAYRVWLATYVISLPGDIHLVKVYKNYNAGLRGFTWSMKDGIGHGNNSGYAALNLAVCLGANPIYLLGFDCSHENGKSHWHKGHPVKQSEVTVQKFIFYFEKASQLLKSKGIRVINLNPESGLNCFPKMDPGEIL
jgi:hypothetical protein